MTDFDTPRPEPKRDRYGRYLLPDPDNSRKELPWTRATTFAKSISDTFGLTKWELRMAVKGVASRSDLYALAAATPIEDKGKLDRIAADAKEVAAASSGANLGSALHGFTERLDRGEQVDVPAPWAADVNAYHAALNAAGVRILPHLIERIVVVPELKVAGTLDRIVTLDDPGRPALIADVKTGKDLSYGWLEISIQLALYAHATAMWNDHAQAYETMPHVDVDQAIVMHLPAGKAQCDLYSVNIAAGWEAAQVCHAVRQWRNRRDLAEPLRGDPMSKLRRSVAPIDDPRPTGMERHSDLSEQKADRDWLNSRIDNAVTVNELTVIWAEADTAGFWTPAHTERAAARKRQLTSTSTRERTSA